MKEVVSLGYEVFFCDLDMVWKRDLSAVLPTAARADRLPEVDGRQIGQLEGDKHEDGSGWDYAIYYYKAHSNTGFYYMRSNNRTVELMRNWLDCCGRVPVDDQVHCRRWADLLWARCYPPPGGSLRDEIFFFLLRTPLKDRPKGPPTANRQLPSTANRHQPPTTNCHQPPATNRRQPWLSTWSARGLFWENWFWNTFFFSPVKDPPAPRTCASTALSTCKTPSNRRFPDFHCAGARGGGVLLQAWGMGRGPTSKDKGLPHPTPPGGAHARVLVSDPLSLRGSIRRGARAVRARCMRGAGTGVVP